MRPTVLLRAEQRDTEQRTPITPKGAAALHEAGVDVVVESSPERVFSDDAYEAVGCPVVHAGSWLTAPPETVVVGIKELPDEPAELRHRHVYFAHAYKGQTGADDLLRRFVRGGGEVLDLKGEALTYEARESYLNPSFLGLPRAAEWRAELIQLACALD